MTKIFVLDTNVLIHDPDAIHRFQDNDLVIPIFVIEEIDNFKKEGSERGRNSRHICRLLDEIRQSSGKRLSDGVPLGNGHGSLRIVVPDFHSEETRELVDNASQDRAILKTAMKIRNDNPDRKVVFVTMDVNLRIRAAAMQMDVEDYKSPRTKQDLQESIEEVLVPANIINELFENGELNYVGEANACLVLRNEEALSSTALARVSPDGKMIRTLRVPREGVLNIKPRNKEQAFALDLLLDDEVKLVTLIGKAGTGKSQPLSEPVVTPTGYVPMGNLKIGDSVIGSDGKPTRVLGVFPQGSLEVYEITFSDGGKTRCSADHLWNTRTYYERNNGSEYKTRTTSAILETINSNKKDKRKNHSIPTASPVKFHEVDVDLDPYLMGLMLGDGCMRHHVSFSTSDSETIESFMNLLPEQTNIVYKSKYDWNFKRVQRNNSKHEVKQALEKYGLFGCYANNKFIPNQYKINSVENRVSLLQGILDSDGTLDYRFGKGVSLTTVSERLRDDVVFLVRSLGGLTKCKLRKGRRHTKSGILDCQDAHVISISLPPEIKPFRLTRKSSVYKSVIGKGNRSLTRYITDIKSVGVEECQCIMVEAKDSLYCTNDFAVTHNTLLAIAAGVSKVTTGSDFTRVLVSRPIMPLGRDIGHLPGDMNEKLNPWMQPIFDNLEFIFGRKGTGSYTELLESGTVQVEPLTYIRGRSLPYQYLIVDEAQNLTPHEIKTIITRAGDGAKIVLTGDPEQIDNPYVDAASNGLSVVAERFRDTSIAGKVVLTRGERSKLAEEAANRL